MKTLIAETENNEPKESTSIDWDKIGVGDLSDSLSEYETVTAETPPANNDNIEEQKPELSPIEDLSDPRLYYQSGKKKGQRKPNKEFSARMTTPENRTLGGDIIDGAMLLLLVDMVIPVLICGANNMFTKVKVDPEKMGLTDAQRKKMEPIFNAITKAIKLDGNPILLGAVSLLAIYLMNLYTLRMQAQLNTD